MAKFDTHLLDEELKRRAERLEAERQALAAEAARVLRSEATRLGIVEAYLVGSVSRQGEWAEDSDVDVAISGGDPIDLMILLENRLERDVDVIMLDRHPVPEMFRRRGVRVVG